MGGGLGEISVDAANHDLYTFKNFIVTNLNCDLKLFKYAYCILHFYNVYQVFCESFWPWPSLYKNLIDYLIEWLINLLIKGINKNYFIDYINKNMANYQMLICEFGCFAFKYTVLNVRIYVY